MQDSISIQTTPIPGFEDPFSALIHLIAALLFAGLTVILIRKGRGNGARVFFLSVFSFACVFQLAISGTYHLLGPGKGRDVLQVIDHAAIFTLIAASFTSIHGLIFQGFMRWGYLLIIWTIAITGITLKSIYFDSVPEWMGLTFFLGLGWMGILSAWHLCKRFGVSYNRFLFYSGIAYTSGAIIEFARAPILIQGVIGPHELFHIAVIAGISYHWLFTYRFADGCVTLPCGKQLHGPATA